MTGLYLGDVSFENFELPARISFGGMQRLAVHKLIGGARLVDTLGRDDLALSWAGVLSGPSAATRALSLDTMRVRGIAENLFWNTFCYSVIISKIQFEYCSPWWIPYEISCIVVADLAQDNVSNNISVTQAVANDLASATSFLGPIFSDAIASASALSVEVAAGQQQALAALASAQNQASSLLEQGQTQLQSDDLAAIASAAGLVANVSCGTGYLRRAFVNLSSLGI